MELRKLEYQGIIAKALQDPGFKARFAAAMAAPLRKCAVSYSDPCKACKKVFAYNYGRLTHSGGADDGCPECSVRLILES